MSSAGIIVIVALCALAPNLEAQQSPTNQSQADTTYEAKVVATTAGDSAVCPTENQLQRARDEVSSELRTLLQERICNGTFGWTQIANVDMTNGKDQCPGGLQEFNVSGKRVCGRGADVGMELETCASAMFPTNGVQYDEVCGRLVAFQVGTPSAFGFYDMIVQDLNFVDIDDYYVDGITLTHGLTGSRKHIWTFATGFTETPNLVQSERQSCPCTPGISNPAIIPPFIGEDYFCESGTVGSPANNGTVYVNDPLWDGAGCFESTTNNCCTFRGPPYFTKVLPADTSDAIEMRACGHFSYHTATIADTFIQQIELYVK